MLIIDGRHAEYLDLTGEANALLNTEKVVVKSLTLTVLEHFYVSYDNGRTWPLHVVDRLLGCAYRQAIVVTKSTAQRSPLEVLVVPSHKLASYQSGQAVGAIISAHEVLNKRQS